MHSDLAQKSKREAKFERLTIYSSCLSDYFHLPAR
jgi:hypothetical protein